VMKSVETWDVEKGLSLYRKARASFEGYRRSLVQGAVERKERRKVVTEKAKPRLTSAEAKVIIT